MSEQGSLDREALGHDSIPVKLEAHRRGLSLSGN
jgi:hypothetical protein